MNFAKEQYGVSLWGKLDVVSSVSLEDIIQVNEYDPDDVTAWGLWILN